MFDSVNEIKQALKPVFCHPYLNVSLQQTINTLGLYDTGADITCINAEVFERIPLARRPVRLPVALQEQYRAASGQELQVQGRFPVKVNVEGHEIDHEFYVIKDMNQPMIFCIDLISKNKLNYCASSRVFKWKGQSEWEKGYAKVQSVQTLLPLQANVCKVHVGRHREWSHAKLKRYNDCERFTPRKSLAHWRPVPSEPR